MGFEGLVFFNKGLDVGVVVGRVALTVAFAFPFTFGGMVVGETRGWRKCLTSFALAVAPFALTGIGWGIVHTSCWWLAHLGAPL